MIRAQLVIWKRKIAPVMLADEGCIVIINQTIYKEEKGPT